MSPLLLLIAVLKWIGVTVIAIVVILVLLYVGGWTVGWSYTLGKAAASQHLFESKCSKVFGKVLKKGVTSNGNKEEEKGTSI